MALTSTLQLTLLRHQREIQEALQQAVMKARNTAIRSGDAELQAFYDQIQYHLGWVDASFSPVTSNAGKMLRPTLLLLAYEAAGAWGMTSSDAGYLRLTLPLSTMILKMVTLSAVIVPRCGNSGVYLKLSIREMGFSHWPG